MEPRSDPEQPFDERAALAELERVREQIQAYRAQRRDIQDEFGRFTRAFKNAEAAAPSAAAVEPVAPPARQLPPPLPPIPPPAPPLHAEVSAKAMEAPVPVLRPPAPAVEPFLPSREPEYVEAPTFDVDSPAAPPRPTGSRAPAVAAAVVAVALLALFAAWMFSGPADQPAAAVTTSPPPAAVEPAPAATPPPAPAVPSPRGSELTTIRRVWMRVMVDGERVVEREVPADTRIPLAAKETIVIRTGDAGAVRLTLAGQDQGFLGREGQVLTRTFTVPPAGAPR